jgi:predicted acetyltransferase
MSIDYRVATAEDIEQVVHVEAVAFYGDPTPERVETQKRLIPPEWTVGAFENERCVASVRTIPMARRMGGVSMGFGAVGPVACLATHRRQGHVGMLLRLALEKMRERGQVMSGLFTPHDALYQRFGWERAEGKKRYSFSPKDVTLRERGAAGRLTQVAPDEWARLDRMYRRWAERRNGPIQRVELWWRESVLTERWPSPKPRQAVLWTSASGEDQGYAVYVNRSMAREGGWEPQSIWIRDFVALSADAYLGLWEHLLTHDIAREITFDAPLDDIFRQLAEDPFKVQASVDEGGAMLRIVDVERAISLRPYAGGQPLSFAMKVTDRAAPWNDATWRVEAAEGRMTAERRDEPPDIELSVNALAPLFTGFIRPEVAALSGFIKATRPETLEILDAAFAVTSPPYSMDWY